MKKVKKRTLSLLVLIAILFSCTGVYVGKLAVDGEAWASFRANDSVYTDGVLAVGTIVDRNGVVLASVEDGVRTYNADSLIRRATLHAVGDVDGNIGTGALSAFAGKLTGYNFVTGTYSLNGTGKTLQLTIDASLNAAAYEALDGRSGTVAVYNYETGEILCMVSSPGFDPADPPVIEEGDSTYDGVYINRFLSASFVPGSIFKLVTLAAAVENIPDLYDRVFTCSGSVDVGGDTVTCTDSHGDMKIEDALAVSCNCAFAELALELGPDTLYAYAEQLGLLESMSVDGIQTQPGAFEKAEPGTADLAWSGIGQYNDQVNPAAMLRLMGAIAGGGEAVTPRLIQNSGVLSALFSGAEKERLLSSETASSIAAMMNYNVVHTYGTDNFPGLSLYAKSGTAEVGGDLQPHAWFVGFIDNADYPLAFVVLVENGGWGSQVAGAVANAVLQAAVGG